MSEMDPLTRETMEDGSPDAFTVDEEFGIETPEADAIEQHQAVSGEHTRVSSAVRFDVDEADAAEQHREVELDEDDYR
ncbi:MAG: hypothetical protein ACRDPK_14150 [Carbonactinosporaceae bacterium]